MKKRILNISLILLLGSTGSVLAQQGIGTNRPDKSAAVDIKSTNKGLLIPRMQLSWDGTKISAPTIDSPAQGLLVYNLTTVTNVPEGFYYFSNDLWNPIGVSELENSETTIITGNGTASLPYQVQVKTADTTTLGVVQIGSGINVNNGVISVPPTPGETTTYLNFDSSTTNLTYLSEDTSTSSLTLNLGDVIRGNQNNTFVTGSTPINIDSSTVGRNTTYNVSVDTATATTLGIVKPGIGLTIDSGSLSVDTTAQGIGKNISTDGLILVNDSTTLQNSVLANTSLKIKAGNEGQVLTTVANKPTWVDPTADKVTTLTGVKPTGNTIGTYKNEDDADTVINETITKITYDSSTNVTYLGEDTSTLVFNLIDEVHKHQKTTTVVGNGAIKVNPTAPSATGNTAYTVSVDTATATTLGVVKPGTGITVASDGTLNVLAQADTVTTLTGVKTTGNAIGTYKNEAGTDVVINETITSIKFDSATTTLTYTPENGVANNIELNLGSIDTDKQQLRLDSNTLTLERSASVDLTKYLDNTDNQSLSFDSSTNVLSITGDSNTIDFTNYKNKAYTLVSDTNTISLLADGTSVDSEFVVKDVALNLSTDNKLTTAVNGVSNAIALDLSSIDTDKQTITDLSLSGTTLTASLERGNTKTVDLSSLKDPITTNVLTVAGSDSNTLQSSVNGTPSNIINLVDKVVLELNGKNLTAKVNGVANTTALDLSTIDTDAQQLKLDSNTLTLDRSASVDLSVLRTKLDTGTNTTLTGDGTTTLPYKVGVNIAKNNTVTLTGDTPVVNNNGVLGLVKPNEQFNVATDGTLSIKYAMPEFFYYPAINIKLDTNTLDLYGIYKSRWESNTMVKSANTEQPNLSNLVLNADMIDIYVTYYDSNVISNVQISNAGVMTYTVNANYTVTDESYMNIVFKVRKTPRP